MIQNDHFNIFQRLFYKVVRHFMSDQQYAEMSMARWLGGGSINNPKTFNEKIQRLKIYHRNALYTTVADKYLVRQFVKEKIGDDFLNECYGIYRNAEEIDWDTLPSSFVMKATHGSGMNILVKDKATVNKQDIVRKINSWLKINYADLGREWVYKNIEPQIIIEKFLVDEHGNIPQDFKVFCFSGVPKYIQVDCDRFCNHTRAFYNTLWVRQPFTVMYKQFNGKIPSPQYLPLMLQSAEKLAEGIPFVRVDFYALPKLVFGEMTFYPENGVGMFLPRDWDLRLGEELTSPTI